MKTKILISMLTLILCLAGTSLCDDSDLEDIHSRVKEAWTAWRHGNLDQAEQLTMKSSGTDEGRHLLFLCAFVKGDYGTALSYYKLIRPTYDKWSDLDEPVLDALLHTGSYEEAVSFAEERNMDEHVLARLTLRSKCPLRVSLDKITVVPFTEHKLTSYFPAFQTTLEGQETIAHIDTGGTFLIMGPDRAAALGIELTPAGEGLHGSRSVPTSFGIAKSFRLGGAVLENVPVTTLASLTGGQDFVIFGTNILQQFCATLDYPNQRLILSPRKHEKLRSEHMGMLAPERVEMPFRMWGDHYMFARGGFGEVQDQNYFIDTGLVYIVPDKGKIRQACFVSTPECYEKWGVSSEKARGKHFESPFSICLGSLEQEHPFVMTAGKPSWTSLGGVQINGLLSHAFLSKYSWTLDFDRYKYIFSMPRDSTKG